MDRSVDSIGSCSLDVDAESTDFSDTSGSLNLCTPSSAVRDFTREFTARIQERQQSTTTVLDPFSGKISTILSTAATTNESTTGGILPKVSIVTTPSTTTGPSASVKKPSYLNLACCVNGYSNLTTYDSKLRQNINKSREVSPIRPIIQTALQYTRGDNNYLVVPVPGQSIQPPTSNDMKRNTMMESQTIISPEKRYFTSQKTIEINNNSNSNNICNGKDVTDNVIVTNNFFNTTKFIHHQHHQHQTNGIFLNNTNNIQASTIMSSTKKMMMATTSSSVTTSSTIHRENNETSKSFIQQRVERLYGPGALAQGFYSPKRTTRNNENNSTTITSRIQSDISSNTSNTISHQHQNVNYKNSNGTDNDYLMMSNNADSINGNIVNNGNVYFDSVSPDKNEATSLPVFRHLRPEFRAQLPIVSNKKMLHFLNTDNDNDKDSSNEIIQYQSDKLINGVINGGGDGGRAGFVGGGSDIDHQPYKNNVYVKSATTIIPINKIDEKQQQQQQQEQYDQQIHCNKNKNFISSNGESINNTTNNKNISSSNNQIGSMNGSITNNIITDANIVVSNVNKMKLNEDQFSTTSSSAILRNGSVNDDRKHSNGIVKHSIANGKINNDDQIQCLNASKISNVSPIVATVIVAATTTSPTTTIGTPLAVTELTKSNRDDDQIEKDGNYFLNILKIERDRLINLAISAESDMELLSKNEELPDEEIFGYLRSAAGKARLLASQKIQQFEGLCYNNLNQQPDEKFPTTAEDLQGFWDMVMLQVDHIDVLFKEIETFRLNNWKKPIVDKPNPTISQGTTKSVKRSITSRNSNIATSSGGGSGNSTLTSNNSHNHNVVGNNTTTSDIGNGGNGGGGTVSTKNSDKRTAASIAAAQKREVQRKQLMELKKKHKQQQQQQQTDNSSVEIFVNETTS